MLTSSPVRGLRPMPVFRGLTLKTLEGLKDGFDGLLRFGAADVRLGDHCVYDVQLDHNRLQESVARC